MSLFKLVCKSYFAATFQADAAPMWPPGFVGRLAAGQSGVPAGLLGGLALQTHMCLRRCSTHCTRTMPSNGECSHTTPQVPSLPTTNCKEEEMGQAPESQHFKPALWLQAGPLATQGDPFLRPLKHIIS